MGQSASQFEKRVIIVGVGLIGGSIAAAVRKRCPECLVIGVGRSEQRLRAAADLGLITDWTTDIDADLLIESAIVVVCLPVNLIADAVLDIAARAGDGILITDAGSVKSTVCDAVRQCDRAKDLFVGSHPIAGGEQGGFEYSDANLFEDKVCVIADECANPTDREKVKRVRRFWESIGCRIVVMTAQEHDRVLALTSHLPHVMAATTTMAAGADNMQLTGSGFRDTTRIAAGDALLWRAILSGNRDEVIGAIRKAERILGKYRAALEQKDDDQVEALLAEASECRSTLDQ